MIVQVGLCWYCGQKIYNKLGKWVHNINVPTRADLHNPSCSTVSEEEVLLAYEQPPKTQS